MTSMTAALIQRGEEGLQGGPDPWPLTAEVHQFASQVGGIERPLSAEERGVLARMYKRLENARPGDPKSST